MVFKPPHIVICLMLALVGGGCALQEYKAKPLDPERTAAQYATRTTDDVGLRRYMKAHGIADAVWPPRQWGMEALTLLAFYFHPDLALARAKAASAHSGWLAAQAKPALGVTPRAEYHGERRPEDSGPWSLGFELDIPVAGASRRAAIVEAERVEREIARMHLARTAWQVRSNVRSAILDKYSSLRGVALSEAEVSQNEALVKLLQRRLQEGMTSVGEVTAARLRSTQARAEVEAQRLSAERAAAQLSAALGLPLDVTRLLVLDYAALETLPGAQEARGVRAKALLNRVDIRIGLLDYAGAESAVKLEIARQYPEWRFSPGYMWDQGDSIWSLALGWVLPATLGNARHIHLAMAKREVEARRFDALQMRVLSEAAAGAAIYNQALLGLSAVESQTALVHQRLGETEKLFAGGYADRVALVQSKLEAAGAARAAWSARRSALDALGQLEDAMQFPLIGGPVPDAGPAP